LIEAAGAAPGLRAAGELFGRGASSGAEALFFDQNDRVGIGTSDPEAQLDVNGSLNADGPVSAPRMSFCARLGQTLTMQRNQIANGLWSALPRARPS
jgi:hypothetical protein